MDQFFSPPEIESIQALLEWAGQRLLSLPADRVGPAGPRVAWPEFPADANLAYGYNATRLRPPPPSSAEIPIMDAVLLWPGLIVHVPTRRVVQARTLITPLSERYLYSWTQIGLTIGLDRRAVRTLHRQGLRAIQAQLTPEKVCIVAPLLG